MFFWQSVSTEYFVVGVDVHRPRPVIRSLEANVTAWPAVSPFCVAIYAQTAFEVFRPTRPGTVDHAASVELFFHAIIAFLVI